MFNRRVIGSLFLIVDKPVILSDRAFLFSFVMTSLSGLPGLMSWAILENEELPSEFLRSAQVENPRDVGMRA